MMTYPTTSCDADEIIKIQMQHYCMADAKITMKILKNLMYGAIGVVDDIIHATGPHKVDGQPWYQVDLANGAAEWLRSLHHPEVKEVEGIRNCFDMPEDIYILTKLKWS